jgi:hypothetical protein
MHSTISEGSTNGEDPEVAILLVQSYSPYGELIDSAGTYVTDYGFAPNKLGQAGEMTDATTGLVNLRARWRELCVPERCE